MWQNSKVQIVTNLKTQIATKLITIKCNTIHIDTKLKNGNWDTYLLYKPLDIWIICWDVLREVFWDLAIFSRPGVAAAILQTPMLLIDSLIHLFIQSVGHPLVQISSNLMCLAFVYYLSLANELLASFFFYRKHLLSLRW